MFVVKQLQNSYIINSSLKFLLINNPIKSIKFYARCIHKHITVNKNYDFKSEVIKLKVWDESLEFPFVWLRDNCQCNQCFHESAKSRILDWSHFNLNVKPARIEESDNAVKIEWDDGHVSNYTHDWLKFRSFLNEDQSKYTNNLYKLPKITWNGEDFNKIFTKHDYQDICNSDKALHDWLHNLSIYGVGLIENAPNEENAIDKVINKIGFTKRTHYGVKFIVQHVVNTSNVAYLSSNLQMHTDLPYYEYCPGVNILHCLVQTASKGGENLLSDCHYVANYMKVYHPKDYKYLTDVEVEWSDIGVENGNEFYKLHRSPVICLNKHGEIIDINFSIPQRGSHFIGAIKDVKPWYEAHGLFLELSHKFAAKFKTKAGEMLVFDNIRLLHGRNAYDDTKNNVRKIIGAYVDWDEIYSRLRCLKVKLQGKSPSN